MDKTDLIMALNAQDEYLPTQQRIEEVVSMLHHSGQDTLIAEALAAGETLEQLVAQLGPVWDIDETILTTAIERALADM